MALALALALGACTTAPPVPTPPQAGGAGDSAPARRLDPEQIADAVPRDEPRSRYGNPASYVVRGKRYRVMENGRGHVERGIASWYGTKFHGRRTSSGEPYDMYAMTAAHKTLPLPSYVRVTNLRNGRSAVVRVNDRGPFHENRIIDLSYAAATKLGILGEGTGLVEIEVIEPSDPPAPPGESPQPPPAKAAAGVYVQAGAFTSLENARRLQQRLQQTLGQPTRIQAVKDPARPLFRVQIGPLPHPEQAGSISGRLLTLGIDHPRVVAE
ncbi:MAG TPA: septal ring lytic transglycosylase RlpA family protein [Sedimenticola sp.]|nr:septal ring lytic transglycosylase RlpA family protein [Sedimenticola sp.]